MLNKEPASINLLPFRPITPYGSEIYRVSASTFSHKKRANAVEIVDENGNVPTLKSHSWWFHKDGREFSLREYARIQDFPDSFKFVGNYDAIKTQIGNAVSPRMAEYIASQIPKSNAISLFSGAGGMDLGFQQAGHNILLSTDWDIYCIYTYRANFLEVPFILKDIHNITIDEIRKKLNGKDVQLIFGGPPCQGFSISGLRFKDDPRNELYKQFLRFISGIKPKYFVMENVMGILSFKEQIIRDMKNEGYYVELKVVKGEEIGMRQKRHRAFFMGQRLEEID